MEQPLAERMLRAFLKQMLRSGAIDSDDVAQAADEAEREGDAEAGHVLRAMIVEAAAPSQADWEADRRRRKIKCVPLRVVDDGKPKT